MRLKKSWILLLCALLLAGCSATGNKNTNPDPSSKPNSAEVPNLETYNGESADDRMKVEGINMQAYLLDEAAVHGFTSSILEASEEVSISFWLEPTTNKPGTFLFSVISENQEDILRMTNMGVNADGSYHGLTLEMKVNGQSEFITSHSQLTLNTYKYNHVVLTLQDKQAVIYLNGEEVVNGQFSHSICEFENPWFVMGKDALSYLESMQGEFQDLKIEKKVKTAAEVKKEFESFYPYVLLDQIDFLDMDDVQKDFWIYPEIDNQYPATWTTSHPEFIKIERNRGWITKPTIEQGNQEVTLTVKTNIYNRDFTKDFVFTVKADSDKTLLERDAQTLFNDMDTILNHGDTLASEGYNGSLIHWQVVSGNAVIENNRLLKTTEAEKEPITLKAILQHGQEKTELTWKATLLDEYVGYILSYFNGELGEERGKLAYSYDGLNWTDLNNGAAILSSDLGNGRIRDPYITRDKDGNFMVLATEGFDNPEIYIMKSPDLINFEQSLVRIAYFDMGLKSSGERAWAPEMTYSVEDDLYYIYYSDPLFIDSNGDKNGNIYYVTTKDFETFSYPKNFFAPGYPVIDGTILSLDGQKWLIYKDEREAAQTVFFASTKRLTDAFGLAYDDQFICKTKFIEGPFVLPSLVDDSYYLYVDNYPNQKFYVANFTKLGKDFDFKWLDESEYTLPEDVRHGSAIAVTQKELDRILAAY